MPIAETTTENSIHARAAETLKGQHFRHATEQRHGQRGDALVRSLA